MKHLNKYSDFVNENFLDDFKSNYAKLFNDSEQEITNTLGNLMKKTEKETDFIKLTKTFDEFLSTNQQILKQKITSATNTESVNKLLSDNLKCIYFALEYIKLKFNDDNFSKTFDRAQDKNFQKLMYFDNRKFSMAEPEFVKQYMIPQIEKMSGVKSTNEQIKEANEQEEQPQTQQPVQTNQPKQTETEDNQKKVKELENYKQKASEWFDYIYGMIWVKLKEFKTKVNQQKQINLNVEQVSKLMKNSTNQEGKRTLLNKIINLSQEELNSLADYLQLNKKEIGDF